MAILILTLAKLQKGHFAPNPFSYFFTVYLHIANH